MSVDMRAFKPVSAKLFKRKLGEIEEIIAGFYDQEGGMLTALTCVSFLRELAVSKEHDGKRLVNRIVLTQLNRFIKERLEPARDRNAKRRPTYKVDLTAVPDRYLSPIYAQHEIRRRAKRRK